MDNVREEGKLELTEGATDQSRLKEFQKGSTGARPNGSLREVRERLSPTPAAADYPAWLTANYPLG